MVAVVVKPERDVMLTVDAAEPRRVAKVIASREKRPEDELGGDGAEPSG